jgi:hypothetical protein
MSKYHEIKAVHERNLGKILEELGMLTAVKEGQVVCKFCRKKLTLENIQCLYPKDDEIAFCCDEIRCFQQALEDSGSGKKDV